MVRETTLSVDDLIYPMFVMEGEEEKVEIASMPGCYRYSLDLLLEEIAEVSRLGINAVALFPVIPENQKDDTGTESYNPEGLIQETVKAIKKADVFDRLVKFFSYDSDKIHGMTSEEKAKFLHNYIYVEDREKTESKTIKCKM
jgi:porphobilinogen synthase